MAIDPRTPSTIYVGTEAGGVYKSSDGGGSWNPSNNGMGLSSVNALAIDPQTPATLYAGTLGGVFKSNDGGGSWTAINSGLTNSNVPALTIDPQNPSRIYAGTEDRGVFGTSVADSLYLSNLAGRAASNDSWITITSGSSGAANGVVAFSVSPKTSPSPRTGTMTIAGQNFTVTQAGVTSTFSISIS